MNESTQLEASPANLDRFLVEDAKTAETMKNTGPPSTRRFED